MWFKNAQLYRLHEQAVIALNDFQDLLKEHIVRPLGDVESRRSAFGAPAGRGKEMLVHEVNGHRLISVIRQERMLPAAVVNEEVDERAAEREHSEGRPLMRRERQALKEQVTEELLPRAFIRTKRIDVWWDTHRQLIGINTSSRKMAEEVLDLLRQTLGSLKVTPLATQTTPTKTMTEWLRDPASRPEWLLLGERAVLRAPRGDDSVLTARKTDLDGDEVRNMIDNNRLASEMAMTLEGQLSLVLKEDFSLKSLRFADELIDEAHNSDDGSDPVLRLETEFVLMAQSLAVVIEMLIEALGGEAIFTTTANDQVAGVDEQAAAA